MEPNLDKIEYRVVLVDPGSRRILVQTERLAFRLVRVSIPARARVARQLRTGLLLQWGIEVVILDFLSAGDASTPCVVAELLTTNDSVHFRAVTAFDISNDELSDQERLYLLSILGDEVTSPFCRIGWMDEVIAWVECATGKRLCRETGVGQHNAGGAFTLLHLLMEDGAGYWLKATAAPNAHERQITVLLSTLCPSCLPRIVAEKTEWNAWLMTGEACGVTSLPTESDDLVHLLGQAVRSLAELQIKTVGRESLLFGAGALDQRLDVIRRNADGLFAYVEEAMSLQTSTKAPQIRAERLKELQEILQKACDHAERMGIPPTILHGDMNLGNLVFTADRCQFIDWSEGYVGHPLVTLQHLLLLNPVENLTVRTRVDDALKGIYRETMSAICDPPLVTNGFGYMAFLAAASALYGRGDWSEGDLLRDSPHLGYVRSVARHMDRSAREPAFRNALCC